MGVPKGRNNFKKLQTLRVEVNSKKINECLVHVKKDIEFKQLYEVLNYVAKKTEINISTLRKKQSLYVYM